MEKLQPVDDKHDLFQDLNSEDETRRKYALKTLSGNVTEDEVVNFVRNLRPYHWQGKHSAIKLLAKFSDEPAIQSLKAFVLDFNPKVRQAARRTLAKLGVTDPYTEDEVTEMVGYLDHPSWWVRLNAIKSIAALKDKRAIDPISRLLLDEDDTVREAARDALAALNHKGK